MRLTTTERRVLAALPGTPAQVAAKVWPGNPGGPSRMTQILERLEGAAVVRRDGESYIKV